MGPRIRAVLREPLLQFLAIGAALFLLFAWRGGDRAGRIVITRAQVEHLRSGFTSASNRPPTDKELDELIEEHVREELAVREAQALGLDRDDTVVRQRLRQKLEFVGESAEPSVPTDTELQAWLTSHADRYRQGPRFAFRQVGVRGSDGSADADAQARRLLARLASKGPEASLEGLGDLKMLPADVDLAPRSEVERLFGTVFADALADLPLGQWSGPVASSFGQHVVFVLQREAEREPVLADARGAVQRDFLAERKARQLDAMYRELRERYRVVIEKEAK
jgi:hypothetical protein